MSRCDRAVGLARPLVISHAIPRRLRRLYADFVGVGDLVFDVGGHAGNHVRVFASLGLSRRGAEPQWPKL